MGSPSDEKPQGTESPGRPARLQGTVYMSARYMLSGSLVLAPSWKPATGEVGVRMASTDSKARA